LKQGTTGRRAGRGPGFRGVLLPAQMALAVVLLSGGVLMMRSFARLVNDPMGAEVHRVLAFEVSLPDYRYHNRQSRRAFLDRAAARLRELPAVESVALSDDVPALERDTVTDIAVANRPGSDFIGKHDVDPGFFSLFRIPLRAGRLFSEHDRQSKVLILSQHAAAILFPGRDPIGMHVNMGDDYAVVGVVGEVRYARQKQQLPLIGDAYVTPATGSAWVTARTAANPAGSIAAVRRVVAQLDPELPAYNLRTLEDQIYEENWGPRFAAVLLSFFAALALALAIVGIYGVFSYAVAARTREFGIRIATGARAADILFMVVREGALLCAIGLAAGIPAALATTRALGSLLYAVDSSDPLTYIATSIVLIATALGACLVPASRAARIDPVVALRCE
jgi:putative ABC transport system permease protein